MTVRAQISLQQSRKNKDNSVHFFPRLDTRKKKHLADFKPYAEKCYTAYN